jgi:hypothetical protein
LEIEVPSPEVVLVGDILARVLLRAVLLLVGLDEA